MKKTVNLLNDVSFLGRKRATEAVFSVLGAVLMSEYDKVFEEVREAFPRAESDFLSRADRNIALNGEAIDRLTPSVATEAFYGKNESDLLDKCLEVVLRVYCDKMLNDKQLDAMLLEIKQFAERIKLNG